MTHPISPDTILPDGVDYIQINNMQIRKGTVAAFISNIKVLESDHSNAQAKESAKLMLNELAPAIVALELHQHITFKNELAEKIIKEAAQKLK